MYALTLIIFKTTSIVVAWTIGTSTRLFIMVTNGLVRVASEPSKVTSPSEIYSKLEDEYGSLNLDFIRNIAVR